MFVVQAMRSGPPERPFLRRSRAEECEHQLKDAARLVRAMREVAVVHARDGEHAQEVRARGDEHELPGNLIQNREHRDHVHHDERDEVVPLLFAEPLGGLNRYGRCCLNVLLLLGMHATTVSNRLQTSSSIRS